MCLCLLYHGFVAVRVSWLILVKTFESGRVLADFTDRVPTFYNRFSSQGSFGGTQSVTNAPFFCDGKDPDFVINAVFDMAPFQIQAADNVSVNY